jgi:hypothetical protein
MIEPSHHKHDDTHKIPNIKFLFVPHYYWHSAKPTPTPCTIYIYIRNTRSRARQLKLTKRPSNMSDKARPCKNQPKTGGKMPSATYTGKESSPKGLGYCARFEEEGARMKGRDGAWWVNTRVGLGKDRKWCSHGKCIKGGYLRWVRV